MSFGKGGGTTVQTAELSPEQRALIGAQTNALTGTFLPAYQQAVRDAQGVYTNLAPGVGAATQNLQGQAAQAQNVLGSTGESAVRTGISGLQNLFGRDYEQQQINAALAPAQAQYQQNLAMQQAQFGGSGNLGSARQALADRALAGSTQAQQAQTAAQVSSAVAAQRAAAATQLAQLGQGGIGQALGAAGQGVSAAMTPQQFYNQYASVLFGTPSAQITPDFRGTQGSTRSSNTFEAGIGGAAGSSPFKIGF
jgi:hypothetical protein